MGLLNSANCTVCGARITLYQFTADGVVMKDVTTITTLHSCSRWCYGHRTSMLCALSSQECSDIRIKALDLRGGTPPRPIPTLTVSAVYKLKCAVTPLYIGHHVCATKVQNMHQFEREVPI